MVMGTSHGLTNRILLWSSFGMLPRLGNPLGEAAMLEA
jgi:hypothetical protein